MFQSRCLDSEKLTPVDRVQGSELFVCVKFVEGERDGLRGGFVGFGGDEAAGALLFVTPNTKFLAM